MGLLQKVSGGPLQLSQMDCRSPGAAHAMRIPLAWAGVQCMAEGRGVLHQAVVEEQRGW